MQFKEISIELKDRKKLEFELKENANAGDYFSLKQVINVDISDFLQKIDAELKVKWKVEHEREEEIKLKLALQAKVNELTKLHIEQIEKAKRDTEITTTEKLSKNFKEQLDKLIEIKTYKKVADETAKLLAAEAVHQNILETKNNKILTLQEEINNYQNQISDLRKEQKDSRMVGAQLELKTRESINGAFNNLTTPLFKMFDKRKIKVIDPELDIDHGKGVKKMYPDVEIDYYRKDEKEVNFKVILECKTFTTDEENKNSHWYRDLLKYAQKSGAHYAVLVSELEWDKDITIDFQKDISDKSSCFVFVVRPHYLVSFLKMLYYLNQKINELFVEIGSAQYKFKKNIIDLLKEFQKNVFEKPFERIKYNNQKILHEVMNIKKSAEKIIEKDWLNLIEKNINQIMKSYSKLFPSLIKNLEHGVNKLDSEAFLNLEDNYQWPEEEMEAELKNENSIDE